MRRKAPWRSKERGCHLIVHDVNLPTGLFAEIHLGQDMCMHTWEEPESEVKVRVAQSCLALCNRMDYTVHGILQARILEWVALPFFRGSSQPRNRSRVSDCRRTLYQLRHRGRPRILEWVTYPFSSGSSQPRNRTRVSALQADSLPTELSGKPWEEPKINLVLGSEPGKAR